jgi:hypothetical protein
MVMRRKMNGRSSAIPRTTAGSNRNATDRDGESREPINAGKVGSRLRGQTKPYDQSGRRGKGRL